jgi:hypothetical protein
MIVCKTFMTMRDIVLKQKVVDIHILTDRKARNVYFTVKRMLFYYYFKPIAVPMDPFFKPWTIFDYGFESMEMSYSNFPRQLVPQRLSRNGSRVPHCWPHCGVQWRNSTEFSSLLSCRRILPNKIYLLVCSSSWVHLYTTNKYTVFKCILYALVDNNEYLLTIFVDIF